MSGVREQFLNQLDASRCLPDLFGEAADIYFFAKDLEFRFTMCNRALLDRLGVAAEQEIIGLDDYSFFERTVADKYREEDEEVFRERSPITNRIWLVPNASGAMVWYLSSKFPLFNRSGGLIGLAGIMRDCNPAGPLLGPYRNLAAAIEFIGANFHKPITVGELAAMSHLSVSQFERSFRKYFKTTPMKYVNQVRLDAAARLLTGGSDSIASVAHAAGFYDHSYFTKQFKAAKGVSPLVYRNTSIGARKDPSAG